jgi:hypothetical protein
MVRSAPSPLRHGAVHVWRTGAELHVSGARLLEPCRGGEGTTKSLPGRFVEVTSK